MTLIGLLTTGVLALLGREQYEIWANLAGTAFQAVSTGVMGGFGVVLSPAGITFRGWNTRHHPWSEIRSIGAVNFLGARRTQVTLVGGSKIRTWAPYDDFLLTDLKFDAKVAAMQEWHARHRPGDSDGAGDRATARPAAVAAFRPPPDPSAHHRPVRAVRA